MRYTGRRFFGPSRRIYPACIQFHSFVFEKYPSASRPFDDDKCSHVVDNVEPLCSFLIFYAHTLVVVTDSFVFLPGFVWYHWLVQNLR